MGGRGGAACDREPSSLNAPTRAGADDLVRGWPLRCWVPCSKPQPSTLGSTRRRRPPQAATRRLLRAARGGLPTLTVDRPRRAPVRVVRKMCLARSYCVVITSTADLLIPFCTAGTVRRCKKLHAVACIASCSSSRRRRPLSARPPLTRRSTDIASVRLARWAHRRQPPRPRRCRALSRRHRCAASRRPAVPVPVARARSARDTHAPPRRGTDCRRGPPG